jgi:hypothetical protein
MFQVGDVSALAIKIISQIEFSYLFISVFTDKYYLSAILPLIYLVY